MKKLFLSFSISLLTALEAFALTSIRVSPKGSDASGDGSLQKPLATAAAAVKQLEKLKQANPNEAFEIVFSEGDYFFVNESDTANFNKKHSGKNSSPLKIRGEGKVNFIGGVRLTLSDLQKVSDPTILSRLPKETQGILYCADLKKFGVKKLGEWKQFGFSGGNSIAPSEVFSDSLNMFVARYPNTGFMQWEKTLRKANPIEKDFDPAKFGKFSYSDPRHERWAKLDDVWLSGVFNPSWAYDIVKVGKIDPQEKSVELANRLAYGVVEETSKYFKNFNRYFAFNMLEEIDANGEYWLDVKNSLIYVMLPKDFSSKASIDISVCPSSLLKFHDGEFFELSNIDFSAVRDNAVYFANCNNSKIDSCNFKNIGRRAAVFSARVFRVKDLPNTPNLSYKNKIVNSSAVDTGLGGFSMSAGERVKLQNGASEISNCYFSNNARLGGSYCPAISIDGMGIVIRHCHITNQAHEGIAWSGNDHTIEMNYFEKCCDSFDDMGAIYTGRNMSCCGNKVRFNFFAEITPKNPDSMMCGVYVDDGSGHFTIEKNIFCRVGNPGVTNRFGTIFFHGGDNNIVSKNIFVDCIDAVAHSPWSDKTWTAKMKEYLPRLKQDVDIHSDAYVKRYGFLKDILNAERSRLNNIWGNLLYNTNLTMRGKYDIAANKLLTPNSTASAPNVKYWNLDEFAKHFGDNPLAKEILDKKPGLLK